MKNEIPQYFSPADIKIIANGNSAVYEFRGLSGDLFAFNSMTIGSDDPSALDGITATATMNEGRDTLFQDVQLLALQRLFDFKSLLGGFVIQKSRALKITITNNSGAQRVVGIALNGYDAPQYDQLVKKYEGQGRKIPNPQFLYASATIAAAANAQRVSINIPEHTTQLLRLAMSSESDANLQVSLKLGNTDIQPLRFLSQYNQQFQAQSIILPVTVDKLEIFEAQVTNLDGANPYEFSIICEAYKS